MKNSFLLLLKHKTTWRDIAMTYTVTDVLQYVEENDVKFVKLQFADVYGFQKNISINASELGRAFAEGFSVDVSNQAGMLRSVNNLLLVPDASTLSILPWRPHSGGVARLICDVKNPDESPFIGDSRELLKKAVSDAAKKGFTFEFGTACEFYLFKLDDNGNPTKIPQDNGGYMDVAPFDRGENIRRDICLTLEQMELSPESSRHEDGPGHNEVDFQSAKALNAADNFLTFKAVVKNISEQNGLYATFMPKPFDDRQGNGLHLDIRVFKNRKNVFESFNPARNSVQSAIIGGLLNRIKDITLFMNPTVNSYKRLGEFAAPKFISWSTKNLSQLLRAPIAADGSAHLILRSGDCAANPYITLALIIYACIDAVEAGESAPAPTDVNLEQFPENADGIPKLPANLAEAAKLAKKSEFVAKYIDSRVLDAYLEAASEQTEKFEGAKNRAVFETENYFCRL